jgi:hypothetical protein
MKLTIATILVLVAATVGAQVPQDSVGLLLGLRIGYSGDEAPEERIAPRYRTLWIVKNGNSVRALASADVLIVPRKTGFWRIGNHQVRISESYAREDIWVNGSPGNPLVPEDDAGDERCRGRSFTQVEFVAGAYLAYASGSESNCGDKDNSWFNPYVVAMDRAVDRRISLAAHDRVSISEPFGSRGPLALRTVARALARRIVRDLKQYNEECCDADLEKSLSNPLDIEWALRREGGKLTAFGYVDSSGPDGKYDGRLPLNLPREAFGWHSSAVKWDSVQRAVPGARDAFRSPNGNLLVVVTATEVLAFVPSSQSVGKPALRISLGNSSDAAELSWWGSERGTAAVMAEWATAPYISKWTSAVDDLSRQPLPRANDRRSN